MELVRQFNSELNSIYEGKLPVSRAKMASITRSAVKSVKHYKHIVMAVEKLISKCTMEYKLPGLYVVDSIVRQSRHQFGTEKDVFGPRFSKNFDKTFRNLFQCTPSDQPKVMRVLNLWQKNEVFPTDVIQKLMALAPNPDATPSSTAPVPLVGVAEEDAGGVGGEVLNLSSASAIIQQQQNQIRELLQQQQQLQNQASTLLAPALQGLISQQATGVSSGLGQAGQVDMLTNLLHQAQHLQTAQNQLAGNAAAMETDTQQPVFNTALLDNDFDYSSEEEEGGGSIRSGSRLRERRQDPPPNLIREISPDDEQAPPSNDPDTILRQLEQQVLLHQQRVIQKDAAAKDAPYHRQENDRIPPPRSEHVPPARPEAIHRDNLPLQEPVDEQGPPLRLPHHMTNPVPTREPHTFPPPDKYPPPQHDKYPLPQHDRYPPPPKVHSPDQRRWGGQRQSRSFSSEMSQPPISGPPPFYPPTRRSPSPPPPVRRDRFHSPPPPSSRGGRGRSPSPPSKRGSSYWRERDSDREKDRDRDSRRSRRSRSPHKRRSRSPFSHRSSPPPLTMEEKERRKKGIPKPKSKHVSVCSCTIWVGHISKTTKPLQINEAFEDYGQVKSVDMVLARGCAYVVMVHRNDAVRALSELREIRIGGSTCKLAWAPGRGVKSGLFRSYWDLSEGVSFIPWDKIKSREDLNELGDGGWLDPCSCPPGMTPPPTATQAAPVPSTALSNPIPTLISMPSPGLPIPTVSPMETPPIPHPPNPMRGGPQGQMAPPLPGHMTNQRPPPPGPPPPHMHPPPPPSHNYGHGHMMPPRHPFMPPPNVPRHMGMPPGHAPPRVRYDHPPPPPRHDYMHPPRHMPPRSGPMIPPVGHIHYPGGPPPPHPRQGYPQGIHQPPPPPPPPPQQHRHPFVPPSTHGGGPPLVEMSHAGYPPRQGVPPPNTETPPITDHTLPPRPDQVPSSQAPPTYMGMGVTYPGSGHGHPLPTNNTIPNDQEPRETRDSRSSSREVMQEPSGTLDSHSSEMMQDPRGTRDSHSSEMMQDPRGTRDLRSSLREVMQEPSGTHSSEVVTDTEDVAPPPPLESSSPADTRLSPPKYGHQVSLIGHVTKDDNMVMDDDNMSIDDEEGPVIPSTDVNPSGSTPDGNDEQILHGSLSQGENCNAAGGLAAGGEVISSDAAVSHSSVSSTTPLHLSEDHPVMDDIPPPLSSALSVASLQHEACVDGGMELNSDEPDSAVPES